MTVRELLSECGRIARALNNYFNDKLSEQHIKKCRHVQMLVPDFMDTLACARAVSIPQIMTGAFVLAKSHQDPVSQLIGRVDEDRGRWIRGQLELLKEHGVVIGFKASVVSGIPCFDVELRRKTRTKVTIELDVSPSVSLREAVVKSTGAATKLYEALGIAPEALDSIAVVPQYQDRSTEEILRLLESVEAAADRHNYHLLLVNHKKYSHPRIDANFDEFSVNIESVVDYILSDRFVSRLTKTFDRDDLMSMVRQSNLSYLKIKDVCQRMKKERDMRKDKTPELRQNV